MENYFKVINENNEEVLCQKLHTFSKNNINYIIYTDFSNSENSEIEILASRYKIENKELALYPIEREEEWDYVDAELENINYD